MTQLQEMVIWFKMVYPKKIRTVYDFCMAHDIESVMQFVDTFEIPYWFLVQFIDRYYNLIVNSIVIKFDSFRYYYFCTCDNYLT